MHNTAKGNCGYVKTAKADIKTDIPEPNNSGITYSTGGSLQKSKADFKKVRFHDLRHTFATTSVANGIDIKTLSTILGHVSSKTTLDIYLHSTEEMKREAAEKINARFNKDTHDNEERIIDEQEKPSQAKFEPKKGKMRKPGTGCISKINDHLYEGRYSPKDAYGKRMARNIYAPTREECEEIGLINLPLYAIDGINL